MLVMKNFPFHSNSFYYSQQKKKFLCLEENIPFFLFHEFQQTILNYSETPDIFYQILLSPETVVYDNHASKLDQGRKEYLLFSSLQNRLEKVIC